jgi:hypothetical protein
LGQLRDIAGGVISERIGGAQLLSDGRLGIGEDPLQIPQQSRTDRTQRVAEQRLELGIGRDQLLDHELQVLLAPPGRLGFGNVIHQRHCGAEAANGLGFLVPQDGAEFFRELTRVGT